MRINWKLRLNNAPTLMALAAAAITFVYNVSAALGCALPVGQDTVLAAVSAVLTLLCGLGIIVDPTTNGVSDSERALGYETPAPNAEEE